MSGSLDINPVLSLTMNRLYILAFALLVFGLLLLILNKTSLGLNVRAVAQNRSMAKAMGIRTDWVDAMTFGLGSGIAGMAGVALSQLTNVGPNLGQAYIIDSFMVVVFGGVGNLWGTLVAGFSLGIANKFLEPVTGAVLASILVLVFIILFIQKKPKGLFPQKGESGRMSKLSTLFENGLLGREGQPGSRTFPFVILLLAITLLASIGNLLMPEDSIFYVSTYTITLLGKYLCYAMLALAVDIIWGYCGILSLGHGAFFALGGYAMGMYLMRQIGDRGVYGNPELPDFMVFLNWQELPWFWYGMDQFWFAMIMVALVPGLLAFVFGWLAFRSRVNGGVSLDHDAGLNLRAYAGLLPK